MCNSHTHQSWTNQSETEFVSRLIYHTLKCFHCPTFQKARAKAFKLSVQDCLVRVLTNQIGSCTGIDQSNCVFRYSYNIKWFPSLQRMLAASPRLKSPQLFDKSLWPYHWMHQVYLRRHDALHSWCCIFQTVRVFWLGYLLICCRLSEFLSRTAWTLLRRGLNLQYDASWEILAISTELSTV